MTIIHTQSNGQSRQLPPAVAAYFISANYTSCVIEYDSVSDKRSTVSFALEVLNSTLREFKKNPSASAFSQTTAAMLMYQACDKVAVIRS